MTLSTHVLDTESGRPATGIRIAVQRATEVGWRLVGTDATDADGRAVALVPEELWSAGTWRLTFNTADHHGPQAFYPQVSIEFAVSEPATHHHIPLLLSRHGYSTYRGS